MALSQYFKASVEIAEWEGKKLAKIKTVLIRLEHWLNAEMRNPDNKNKFAQNESSKSIQKHDLISSTEVFFRQK